MADSAYHDSDKFCHSCERNVRKLCGSICYACYARQIRVDPNRPRCSGEGCDKPAARKGLCDKHYERQRRLNPNRAKCSVAECDIKATNSGFCDKHYYRFRKYGDPLAGGTFVGDPDKFLADNVFDSEETKECIIWPFGKFPNGSALISRNGAPRKVCQIVLEKTVGPAPKGKEFALHKCGKGHLGCCNPNHLYWGDHHENMTDMINHGTSSRGVKNVNAKLTPDLVRYIRKVTSERTISQRKLAKQMDISRTTICDIISGKTWYWLD